MPEPPAKSRSGTWFLAGVGLATTLAGALFVWLLATSFQRASDMRHWPQVPCTILISSVEERQHDPFSAIEYRHQLLFGYEYKGERHTSSLFSLRGGKWSSQRERAAALAAEWPAGMRTTCRVSPADPAKAVLKPDSLAPGYTLWFPMLFVVGGLVIVWKALRPAAAKEPS